MTVLEKMPIRNHAIPPSLTMPIMTITEFDGSPVLLIDDALCERAGLTIGDQVDVTVGAGGSIVLTPVRDKPEAADAADRSR